MRTPTSSTRCWYCEGTANFAMIRTKTKRLSTLSDFSVMKPHEELAAGLAVTEDEQAESEESGEGDPDDRPDSGFLDRHVMRLAADEEIDRDEGRQPHDGQDPQGHGNIHYCSSGGINGKWSASSLPEVSSTLDGRPGPTPRDLA